MSRRGRGAIVVRSAFGIGLIAYLALSGMIDWSALFGLLESWRLSLAALLLLFLVVVLVSWRLCILLAAQHLELPLGASLRLTLIGAFFNAFLPGSTGGDVARIYLAAKPNAGHGLEITTIVLVDRAIGFLALLVLPVLVAYTLGASSDWPNSVQVLVRFATFSTLFVGLAALLAARSHGPLRRVFIRVLGWVRLDRPGERFFDTLYTYRHQRTSLLAAFLLSLLIQAASVAALLLLALATGVGPVSWRLAILIPFGMLANALPITPGGIGVGEAAFEALFRAAGATGGAETILAWRVITTLIDLCGGALLVAGHTDMSMIRRLTTRVEEEQLPLTDDRDDAA